MIRLLSLAARFKHHTRQSKYSRHLRVISLHAGNANGASRRLFGVDVGVAVLKTQDASFHVLNGTDALPARIDKFVTSGFSVSELSSALASLRQIDPELQCNLGAQDGGCKICPNQSLVLYHQFLS